MRLAQPRAEVDALASVPGRRALDGVITGTDVLRMHLQPVVELATGQIWGVEALARFPGHPEPGPEAWFSSALVQGCGAELEERALQVALDLRPRLPRHLRLTVNVSAETLLQRSVQSLLRGSGGAGLLIELTEHEQVRDYPALLRVLADLRATGIGLCIDDFGAGHSSLQHVLHLEPDVVKLDLALVQGVGQCRRRQALVEAMLAFCRSTETVLVAEGVEHADDLERLVQLGVGHAQGWFLARPAGLEVVLPVLTARARPPVLVLP